MPPTGRLIVIEGIDGTGKTTLARAVRERLERRGVPVTLSREPTDGPHGRRIRERARSGLPRLPVREETELFIADREEHVRDLIRPELERGRWVILDRYYFSTAAYQGARGEDIRWILDRHRSFAPEPDLLVILKLDTGAALERIRGSRGDTPDHFERAESLAAVSLIFDHLEHPRLLPLDAKLPTEIMADRIMEALDAWIEPASESHLPLHEIATREE